MFNTIRARLTVTFVGLSIGPLLLMAILLAWLGFTSQRQQALAVQSELAQRVATEVTAFIQGVERSLSLTAHIGNLSQLSPAEQRRILVQLWEHNEQLAGLTMVNGQGTELFRITDVGVFSVDSLGSRSEQNEFLIPMLFNEPYYSPVHFDAETNEPVMTISVPLPVRFNQPRADGVLIAELRFKSVWDLIAGLHLDSGEQVYITDVLDRLVAHADPSLVITGTRYEVPGADGLATGLHGDNVVLAVDRISLGNHVFYVVAEQRIQDALTLAINSIFLTIAVTLVALVVAIVLGYIIVQRLTEPINRLAALAQSVEGGDLSQRADVGGLQEMNLLGQAFNSMTAQLQQVLTNLELRVAERTRALETSLEVGRRLSTILDQSTLVSEVVEQVRAAFDYYHAHIYLLDENGQRLIMVGGTGEAGQAMLAGGHKLGVGKGLVGRAAQRNEVVLVPDVAQDPNWLPNPILPDTKAEVAVPITLGGEVLGVLDVQHNVTDGLTVDDVTLLQSIASQVAIALQNATLYEQAHAQAQHEVLINSIGQKIQQAATIETVLQVAVRELGRTLGSPQTKIQLVSAAATGNGRQSKSDDHE